MHRFVTGSSSFEGDGERRGGGEGIYSIYICHSGTYLKEKRGEGEGEEGAYGKRGGFYL